MNKYNGAQKISLTIVLLVVGMMISFVGVPSAFAYETSGWLSFGENLGADSSCGGSKNLQSWKIMDEKTGASIIPTSVKIEVVSSATGKVVASSSQAGVSETTPLCCDATTQYFRITVDVGAGYYDIGYNGEASLISWGKNSDGSVDSAAKNRRYRGHIYLRPKSFATQARKHDSPIGIPYLNAEPSYVANLMSFPSSTAYHGALTPYQLETVVYESSASTMASKVLTSSLGKGKYTQGPIGLSSDGFYWWSYFFYLKSLNKGTVVSPWSGWEGFCLDKTLPVISVSSVLPVSPVTTDAVVISANVQDVLSGLSQVTLYIDGVAVGTSCPYTGTTAIQTCTMSAGSYTAGTHSYYVVAKDRAGNVVTSTSATFTVGSVAGGCVNTVCVGSTTWSGVCNGACGGGTGTELGACDGNCGSPFPQSRTCINGTACPVVPVKWIEM